MYYGNVIASSKQVLAAVHQSLSLSFRLWIPQVRVSHSATRVLLHLADRAILCIFHAELQVLHVAAIIISLFKHVLQKRYEVRTDGEVAVFVRGSASLVTAKTDKMDTDHGASSAWTDSQMTEKGPEDWTDCTVTD